MGRRGNPGCYINSPNVVFFFSGVLQRKVGPPAGRLCNTWAMLCDLQSDIRGPILSRSDCNAASSGRWWSCFTQCIWQFKEKRAIVTDLFGEDRLNIISLHLFINKIGSSVWYNAICTGRSYWAILQTATRAHTGYNNKSRTFWRNMMSRCKELCSGDCATSWLKRFTVIVSGRVQKEERCVGHSAGRDNMLAGSPNRIFIMGLPTCPPPVVILLRASARFCCKSWISGTSTKTWFPNCCCKCVCATDCLLQTHTWRTGLMAASQTSFSHCCRLCRVDRADPPSLEPLLNNEQSEFMCLTLKLLLLSSVRACMKGEHALERHLWGVQSQHRL